MTHIVTRGPDDRTRLSYWYPRLRDAGIPTPRTETVRATDAEAAGLMEVVHGGVTVGAPAAAIAARLATAAAKISAAGPWFLRTDYTSGKHEWARTCCVTDRGLLERHVYQLAEHSAMADILGLPVDVWHVREFLLPTRVAFVDARFGGLPVAREFRVFVEGGVVTHWQPYWPPSAFDRDGTEPARHGWRRLLRGLSRAARRQRADLEALAVRAAAACGGDWSVDLFSAKDRGWLVTDMAAADLSVRYDPDAERWG